jgi:hypothetical protein
MLSSELAPFFLPSIVEIATGGLSPPAIPRALADPAVPKANAFVSIGFGNSKPLWTETVVRPAQLEAVGVAMSVHAKVGSQRSTDHRRVLISGLLVTPAGDRRVMIRDISPTGAQVTCREKLPSHCDVILKRGSLFAAARLDETGDGEASLRFYRELTEEEIERALFSGGQ